jgi:hypothetical protein
VTSARRRAWPGHELAHAKMRQAAAGEVEVECWMRRPEIAGRERKRSSSGWRRRGTPCKRQLRQQAAHHDSRVEKRRSCFCTEGMGKSFCIQVKEEQIACGVQGTRSRFFF